VSGERKLISAILARGELTVALEKGITESVFFDPTDKKCFSWIFKYYVKFRSVPKKDRFQRQFPNFRLVKVPKDDPFEDICEEVLTNVRYKFLIDNIRELAEMVDEENPQVYDKFISAGLQLSGISAIGDLVKLRDMPSRIQKYEKKVSDNIDPMGISFGLPTLDRVTMGMQPGDLVAIAARLGTGKSNLLKHIIKTAFLNYKNVLVFSLEESPAIFERRLDAMVNDLPYEDLKWMKLKPDDLTRWKTNSVKFKEYDNDAIVVKNVRNVGPETIFSYAQRFKPDLIAIDGMHLLRMNGNFSVDWKQITTILSEVKNIALYTDIPIVGVVQSNRASAKEGVNVENISFADAIGQLCDIVVGIWQNQKMEKNKVAQVRPAKVRDGPKNVEILCKWVLGPGKIIIRELKEEEIKRLQLIDPED